MGFDALEWIQQWGDVWQPGQGNHQGKRWHWIKIALQPEIPQGDVSEVNGDPGEIDCGDNSNGLVPPAPAEQAVLGLECLPAWTDHGVCRFPLS